ncbi:Ig-like domain-containing protein, partial [Corynebacterium aquatimens]
DGVKSSVNEPGKIAVRYQLPVTTTHTATTTERETATTTVPTVVPTTVTTTADGVPTTITTTVPTVVPTTLTETATSTTTAVNNIFTLPNIEHTVRENGPVTFTPKYPSNVDPKTVRFIDGTGKEVNVLDVVGQGRWTVLDNGEVTFTPVDGFTGLPAAVSYTASTRDGVKAVEPAQIQISRHLPVTTTNTTTATATETATATATTTAFVPTTVVNNVPTTVTTAVPTTVTTSADGVPTTITTTVPTVVPTTVRETSTVFMLPDLQRVATKTGQVSFLPDYPAQVKRDTVRFLDGNGGEVNVLVVPGQGRWNVDGNGEITFIPENGFTGDPTPVAYTASTVGGAKASAPAKISVRYQLPVTSTVTTQVPTTVVNTTTVAGTPTTITKTTEVPTVVPTTITATETRNNTTTATATATVTNTQTFLHLPDARTVSDKPGVVKVTPNYSDTVDRASIRLIDPAGNEATTVQVPGQGTWTVNGGTGEFTFTPENGFTGNPDPIAYTAQTRDGVKAQNNGTVTVSYQLPVTQTQVVTTQVPTTITTVQPTTVVSSVPTTVVTTVPTTTTELVPTTVTTGIPTTVPTTVSTTVTLFTLSDIEKVATTGGKVEFAPNYPAQVKKDAVRFIDGAGREVQVLKVNGEGTWTVDSDGRIAFTPEDGFSGNPTPVQYTAETLGGTKAVSPAKVSVRYQLPVTQTQTTVATTTEKTTERTTETTTERTTETTVREVPTTVPTTIVTTEPVTVTTGIPTTVSTTVPTTLTTTVPTTFTTSVSTTVTLFTLSDIEKVATSGGKVEFVPNYPAQVKKDTVRFIDGSGREVQVLKVVGEGTWTVDSDGRVTFTPDEGFNGDPTPVSYVAETLGGIKAMSPAKVNLKYQLPVTQTATATATETTSVSVPTTVTTTVRMPIGGFDGKTVAVEQVQGEALAVTFDEPDKQKGSVKLPNGARTKAVAGKGQWRVNPDTDVVTFEPEPDFVGEVEQDFIYTDNDGVEQKLRVRATYTPRTSTPPTATATATATVTETVTPSVPAPNDGSSAQAKLIAERCFGNALQSPIAWLLPLALVGVVVGKAVEPIAGQFGAQIDAINRQIQQNLPNPGRGGHGGNDPFRQINEQVAAINAQFRGMVGPAAEQIGQAIGAAVALGALIGLLYDWCSNDVGKAKTSVDFEKRGGKNLFREKSGESGSADGAQDGSSSGSSTK